MPGKQSDSESRIKVSFRQSGGYAGLILGSDLDTGDLPPGDAQRLRAILQSGAVAAALAGGAASRASPPAARDLTSYEIEVKTPTGSARLAFDDMSAPPGIEPLLEFLRTRARPRPPR